MVCRSLRKTMEVRAKHEEGSVLGKKELMWHVGDNVVMLNVEGGAVGNMGRQDHGRKEEPEEVWK